MQGAKAEFEVNTRRAVVVSLAASFLEVILPVRRVRAAQTMREGQTLLAAGRFKALLELAPIHVGAPNDLVHLIAFFDPNCPWCAQLWTRIYGTPNTLASAWIPVPYMKKSSAGRAAAILRAPVPATALADNFSAYDATAKNGGIEPVNELSTSERSRFSRYIAAWSALTPATPLMVYVSKDGLSYCQVGLPSAAAIAALLQDLPSGKLTTFP